MFHDHKRDQTTHTSIRSSAHNPDSSGIARPSVAPVLEIAEDKSSEAVFPVQKIAQNRFILQQQNRDETLQPEKQDAFVPMGKTVQLVTNEPAQLAPKFAGRYAASAKIDHKMKKQQNKQLEKWEKDKPKYAKKAPKRAAKKAAKKAAAEKRKKEERNRKNGEKFLGLGDDKAWMEIIDGRYHDLGANTFDEGLHAPVKEDNEEEDDGVEHFGDDEDAEVYAEPGYLSSMMNARKYVANTMGQKMDDKYLEQIHNRSAAHKQNGDDYHSGYRNQNDTEVSVSYSANTADEQGDYEPGEPQTALEELDPNITRAFHTEGFDIDNDESAVENAPETLGNENDLNLWFKTKSAEQVRAEVNKIMKDYYAAIKTAVTRRQKLVVVSTIHRRLENLHPFIDANTRTNRLVLHRMLVENGMSPVILENPLEVHLKSNEEWADHLDEGMTKWEGAKAAD
jgi:hypothetical protein